MVDESWFPIIISLLTYMPFKTPMDLPSVARACSHCSNSRRRRVVIVAMAVTVYAGTAAGIRVGAIVGAMGIRIGVSGVVCAGTATDI